MDVAESIGFISGLLCVGLNTQRSIWAWPLALISVTAYAYVFWFAGLYADMGLQVFFFINCVYGWYFWLLRKERGKPVIVHELSASGWYFWTFITFLLTVLLYFFLQEWIKSDVPFLDGFTTSLSIVAQLLLARKFTENWLWWIMADMLYVGLYLYKNLYLTAGLYLMFTAMAIYGYVVWRKNSGVSLV